MRWVYGIIAMLLVLAIVVGCTMESNTEAVENDLDLEGVEALDTELDEELDTAELDQLIEDLDNY